MSTKERLLLGGQSAIYQEDANEGFGNSPETGVSMRIRTKRHIIDAPAGESVGKRMFISAEHNRGIKFEVIPVGDGTSRTSMRLFFQRPGRAGEPKRESFLVPLQEDQEGGAFTKGLRATTFGARIVTENPDSSFNLESIQFEVMRLQSARGRSERE